MRKWITLLMTLLVGCGFYANANTGQVSFEAGYRRDTIDWKTRFPSDDPLFSSSTKFKDLDIFQIGIHGRSTLCYNFYVRGAAYWGWILDGDYTREAERDFGQENYSTYNDNLHLSSSDCFRSTVDDHYVFGIGAGIGYPFYFCDCTLMLAPVVGYAFDEQNVRVDDRDFGFANFDCAGNGGCCRHSFISRWYGPFVGVDFDWRPWNSCFNIWAELEYHWGCFKGKRSHLDDNLGLASIDHRNRRSHDATAWAFAAGFEYDLCNCWTIGLSVKFQDWRGNRHHHRFFRESNDENYLELARCDHRLKDHNKWRSYAINLTFGRDF